MEVYGLNFCEVHGGEARAGALREAVAALQAEDFPASEHELAALRRAYPVIPARVIEDTPGFNYDNPLRESTPIDWHQHTRFVLHRLMRHAYEGGEAWLVEVLEKHREHESAQLAFALADYEERVGNPPS